MIFPESKIEISDNSGGLKGRCIKILKGSKKKGAGVGSLIVLSVIKAIPHKKVKKKQIHKAIVIRTKQWTMRKTGLTVNFNNNACILVNSRLNPLAKRMKGPSAEEVKKYDDRKLKSMLKANMF